MMMMMTTELRDPEWKSLPCRSPFPATLPLVPRPLARARARLLRGVHTVTRRMDIDSGMRLRESCQR